MTTTTTPPNDYDYYLIREKTLDDDITVIGTLCNIRTGEEWFTIENKKYIIPCGDYKFKLRKSPRFGLTPWIYTAENREYILMHIGNTASDSHGCILIGDEIKEGERELRKSRKGFERLMNGLAPMRDYKMRIEWQLF